MRLWVRETWYPRCADAKDYGTDEIIYRADYGGTGGCVFRPSWNPSIFMPRWASRITLEVTGVRAERVQDITEEDAKAEGVILHGGWNANDTEYAINYRGGFSRLWDSINAKRGYGWDKNPWVWVIEFKRLDGQIWEQTPEVLK